MIQIKHRFNGKVIYESKKETMKEAVEEAVLSKADLSWADLFKANLFKADLFKADLSDTNLSEADLSKADLSKANLSKTHYWKTNFKYCKVTKKVKEQIIEMMKLEEVKDNLRRLKWLKERNYLSLIEQQE